MTAKKQRHGCLTTWLIFLIVGNSIVGLITLLAGQTIQKTYPTAPDWVFLVLAALSIFRVICAIALWKWKKWGFWGILASTVAAWLINLSIENLAAVLSPSGFIGVALLWILLNIGENKAWSQLE